MPKDLKKLLLYPILIYGIISLEVAAIVLLGFDSNVWLVWVVTTVFVTALVFTFAFVAKPLSYRKGLTIGAVWEAFLFCLTFALLQYPSQGLATSQMLEHGFHIL
jgi:hypothetical protein